MRSLGRDCLVLGRGRGWGANHLQLWRGSSDGALAQPKALSICQKPPVCQHSLLLQRKDEIILCDGQNLNIDRNNASLYKYKICPPTSSTNVILSGYQYTPNCKHTIFPSSSFRELIEVHALSRCHSAVSDSVTLWKVAHQALPFRGFFRQEHWSERCHFLLLGIFPTQGLNTRLLHCRWFLYRWASRETLEMHEVK